MPSFLRFLCNQRSTGIPIPVIQCWTISRANGLPGTLANDLLQAESALSARLCRFPQSCGNIVAKGDAFPVRYNANCYDSLGYVQNFVLIASNSKSAQGLGFPRAG